MLELIVTSPFENYTVGQSITDPLTINAVLLGPFAHSVVPIDAAGNEPGTAETISAAVISAAIGIPLGLAGTIANAAPAALEWSTDGATWLQVGSFVLSAGNWTGTGPVYATAQTGSLVVRDSLATWVQSAPAAFTVVAAPSGASTPLNGTITLADGSIIDSIGPGLSAPQGAANTAGALSVGFGTTTGSVADGGALAAETAARTAGDAANASALAATATTVQSAQAAAATAQSAATAAQSSADAAQATAANAQAIAAAAQSAAASAGASAAAAQNAASTAQTTASAAQGTAMTAAATASNGTITLAGGTRITGIGEGLSTGPGGAGPLSVTFGTIPGTVADGGTMAATQATASAAQSIAAAALPASELGTPGGAAALDSTGHVPLASLPPVEGQSWTSLPATAAIFHRGPVPTPATPRAGLLLGDVLKITGEFNFGEIWDTQATYDAWPVLQDFLLYCQSMALAMKNDSIDNLTQRNCVRAILPRGAYLISQPLIVPEYVDLDCRGTLYRAAYTGDQTGTDSGSAPGIFATNQYLPTVVITPRAHAANLNIYVNTDGDIAHRGSGVCIGKTWAARKGSPCIIGNPGAGYSVGDTLYMAQPSAAPYFNWAAQVTAISGGGATGPIAAATVSAAGAYALPSATYNGGPSLQLQQWTAANGFPNILDPDNPGCFQVAAAYASNGTTASAGTGATLAPVWQGDYVSGTAAYNIGSAITNGSQIGKLQITGGIPVLYDPVTYGPTFGVMITGLETVIQEIQLLGGNVGVYGYFGQDVRIGTLNVVEAGVGVELFGCGSWHCPLVVLDTCGAAFLINETQGVRMGFRAFFEQGNIGLPNAYPNSLGNAIQIGTASSAGFPNADIHLEGDLVNMGGLPASTIALNPGTAVGSQSPRYMAASIALAWLFSSMIRVKVTNVGEQGGVPTILPTSGFCQFGFGVDAGNVIEGSIDTIPTIDGTPPPAQAIFVPANAGHGFPGCAIRVWDGLHQCWLGPFNTIEMFGTAAPSNGTSGTGAGLAMPGSTYVDTTGGSGRRYVNTGTQSSPVWS